MQTILYAYDPRVHTLKFERCVTDVPYWISITRPTPQGMRTGKYHLVQHRVFGQDFSLAVYLPEEDPLEPV